MGLIQAHHIVRLHLRYTERTKNDNYFSSLAPVLLVGVCGKRILTR